MNREDLYRSFNNIDDDILERSEANKKRLSYTWKKWGAIAACLCILVIGAISILNDQSGIEMEKPMVVRLVGSVVENNAGTLTYHTDNYSEHVMGFTLVKKDDMEMYIRFDGHVIKDEWEDEDCACRNPRCDNCSSCSNILGRYFFGHFACRNNPCFCIGRISRRLGVGLFECS